MGIRPGKNTAQEIEDAIAFLWTGGRSDWAASAKESA